MRGMKAVACVMGLFLATPASAQGVFDLGALTNTISQSAGQQGTPQQSGGKVAPPPSAANIAKLSFQPSPGVRSESVAEFVKVFKTINADAGSQMEAAFAQVDIIEEIGKAMAPYGMKTDNMADAYGAYVLSAWMGANGRTEDATPAQMAGMQTMARNALTSVPDMMNLDNTKKQRFTEALLLQIFLYELMQEGVKQDPSAKTKVQADIKAAAKEMGIDTDAFTLTPNGLVRK
jgi:hypothetical protein